MHPVRARQLVERLLLLERRYRDLRLERRRVSPPLLPHPRLSLKPSSSSHLNLPPCPVSGDHYRNGRRRGAAGSLARRRAPGAVVDPPRRAAPPAAVPGLVPPAHSHPPPGRSSPIRHSAHR